MAPFIVDKEGPPGVFAVFEDDGETGYLYVYEPEKNGITRHLHVYDRSPQLTVSEADVSVLWSEGNTKVGVVIRNAIRAIIDLENAREDRVWMQSDASPGIADAEWPAGF